VGEPSQLDEEVGEPHWPGIRWFEDIVVEALEQSSLSAGALWFVGQQPSRVRRLWSELLQQAPPSLNVIDLPLQYTADIDWNF